MKKILVTGGCGFIGSHLVDALLKKRYEVLNVDCLTYSAVKKKFKDQRYKFKKISINSPKIEKIIKTFLPDILINCAAESHVDNSIKNSKIFLDTNIFGVYNLLNSLKNMKKKILFYQISTDEVFGDLKINEKKFTEKSLYNPKSPYSATKAAADHLVRSFGNTYKIPYLISNCSNNYGIRQHKEKFIPTIINACLEKKKIPIYGKGRNIRDWIHVSDHVSAIIKILEKGKMNSTYVIGGKFEKTNLYIVKSICKFFNKKNSKFKYESLIKFVKDRNGHDFRYGINFSKIKIELGWKPKKNFFNTLDEIVNYYKNIK